MALDVLARGRPDLAEEIIPGLLAADAAADDSVGGRAGRRVAPAGRHWPRRLSIAGTTSRSRLAGSCCRYLGGSTVLAEPLISALERAAIAPGELDASLARRSSACPTTALGSVPSAVLAKSAPPPRGPRRSRVIRLRSSSMATAAGAPSSLPGTVRPATSARARATAWAPIFRASPAEPPRRF